jgi:hypothetical protein
MPIAPSNINRNSANLWFKDIYGIFVIVLVTLGLSWKLKLKLHVMLSSLRTEESIHCA